VRRAVRGTRVLSCTDDEKITFSSKYTGKASLLINNGQATISSVTGLGKNSLFVPAR